MDVDTTWHRKRPIEEEEYQEKKRFLSEKFFNMRISDTPSAGLMGRHSVGHMTGPSVNNGDGDDEEAMDETEGPSFGARQMSVNESSVQLDPAGAESDEEDDSDFDDIPAPFLSRGRTHTGTAQHNSRGGNSGTKMPPHPFKRSTSSPVDDKIEDWLRTSRHRLLADASVGASSDSCRALTIYKPLSIGGGGGSQEDGGNDEDGEAGGDPTPSPRVSGNGGGDGVAHSPRVTASSSASTGRAFTSKAAKSRVDVQSAGSGTAEAAANAGGGGSRSRGLNIFGALVPNGERGLQTGGGLAHSAADDAAGPMTDIDDSVDLSSQSAMQILEDVDMASPDCNDSIELLADASTQPALTRVGTSRGLPTPELTPEWVALARMGSGKSRQAPGEMAGDATFPTQFTAGWGCW